MRPLKVYWCDREVRGRKNFGDWISPELCQHLSGRPVEYADERHADLVAVGSILHRVPTHFWSRRVDVWGAGLMHDKSPGRGIHRYHAVRGELTARLAGAKDGVVLGDPGLLVNLLFPHFADVPKRWDIGIVPHHIDQGSPSVAELSERLPGCHTIDILSGTQEFLAELAACRQVLSSSLHGLIAADAFGIPNAWITISDQIRGDGFKFRDYYTAFKLTVAAGRAIEQVDRNFIEATASEYRRPGLPEIKARLMDAFPYPRA
jgi:hypothetical protein